MFPWAHHSPTVQSQGERMPNQRRWEKQQQPVKIYATSERNEKGPKATGLRVSNGLYQNQDMH